MEMQNGDGKWGPPVRLAKLTRSVMDGCDRDNNPEMRILGAVMLQ